MTVPRPLPPERLYRRTDPALLPFETTGELEPEPPGLGQERAAEALALGVTMAHDGFNVFALGPEGLGKHTLVLAALARVAAGAPPPDDWVCVHNFEQGHRPRVMRLPAGRGTALKHDMAQLVEELKSAIPAIFDSDEYRARVEQIDAEFSERHERAIGELGESASAEGIALVRTPAGFSFAPTRDGEVLGSDEFSKLPEEEQQRMVAKVRDLESRLEKVVRQFPRWRRERRDRVKALNEEFIQTVVGHPIDELKERHADFPGVLGYLDAVRRHVTENAQAFSGAPERPAGALVIGAPDSDAVVRFYQINVLVDARDAAGAPVVMEDHPTFPNLLGRIEYTAQFGALVTDYTLIRAGAVQRANGGYLLLDAWKLLTQPYAWEGLKRALKSREGRIESLGQALGLISTVSLEPEPIPLNLKVVLFGARRLYYLLHFYDPEFRELFKVAADFEDDIRRDGHELGFARMLAGLAREHGTRPLARDGVARVMEHAARLAGDAERLSTHMQSLADLVREADHQAVARQAGVIGARDVEAAATGRLRRADRAYRRFQDAVEEGTLLVSTDGEAAGQVNGLSVFELGGFAFGLPTRITATTRFGDEGVIDIQREAELGGAIHSKGVMILASFFAARYSGRRPLSLAASLAFEQTYGVVEGDSASLAELCALLSSLAGVPARQALAVTGSVNQLGAVQAIGAVNEKIEGFFDVCRRRGLTGRQGVLVPAANVRHLMLRQDVVAACRDGRFAIYPVATVDEGMELLTGVPAGTADAGGNFPRGSVNARVVERLAELTETRRQLLQPRLRRRGPPESG
ncbi:MAG: Lon protease family protein [Pseudomonadota bacterium]